MMGNTLVPKIRDKYAKEIDDSNQDNDCRIITIPNILY